MNKIILVILIIIILILLIKKINIDHFDNDYYINHYIEKAYPVKINILNNFINKKDIDYIIKNTKKHLKDSTIVGENGNQISNWRTSKTVFINKFLGEDNYVIKKINKKVSKILNINEKNLESINLTYYNKGNQYKNHHDYFDPKNSKGDIDSLKESGQRLYTIFVYLKNAEEGGETNFPKLNKKFKLKEGDAILWENAKIENGKCILNTNTLHAGLPPLKGEKYGMNIWIREREVS